MVTTHPDRSVGPLSGNAQWDRTVVSHRGVAQWDRTVVSLSAPLQTRPEQGTPMLEFVSRPQQFPPTRVAEQRRKDFKEIHEVFQDIEAAAQSARCSQCGVPYCQIHCPLGNNIPDWLMLAANGRLEEAWQTSNETNAFPEFCGRICPQDRLCEGNCVIEASGHGTVTIGSVESYLTENAFQNGWIKPIVPAALRQGSAGIIGAGPAGLAAAIRLREAGFAVHVYDAHDRVGGLLMYGIPNFKLEKSLVERRTRWLEASGIKFHLGCRVGVDKDFASIRAEHEVVLVATGTYQARPLGVSPGAGTESGSGSGSGSTAVLTPAMDYLIASIRSGLGDIGEHLSTYDAADEDVIVVGGGDTAMDCVRTAIRQGARSVRCLYRRDRASMPGSQREVEKAIEEGVDFLWFSAPSSIVTDDQGALTGLKVHEMRQTTADGTGRRGVEPSDAPPHYVQATRVILALGYDAEDLPGQWDAPDLATTRWGTIKAGHGGGGGDSLATSLPGVFAAGDIYRGASLVVWAIKDGMQAAEEMVAYFDTHCAPAEAA